MNKREIVSLMHRLHYGDIDTTDRYVHLMVDGLLSQNEFESFVRRYIAQGNLVVYANSQTAMFGNIQQAFYFTREHMDDNRIRIASEDFLAKIVVEPTGVAVGHLTNKDRLRWPQPISLLNKPGGRRSLYR